MSTVNNGPQIVRTGLVLDLDAGYIRSYSPNVMPNPTDIFAWCGSSGVNCTLSRDSTMTRQYGSIPLKMVVSANDPNMSTYNSPTWNLAPAATGQTWTVSVYVKASVATNVEGPVIFECNSSGTYLAVTSAGSISVTTSWTRISYSVTFGNASTAFIQVRLDGTSTGGSGITIWWDGLQVERASSATTFNPYYIGNTTWRDVSGNANNGTLTNGPTFSNVNGGVIVLDGTDDYVSLTSTDSLRPSNVTLSVWFNRNNSTIVGNETIAESRKSSWVSYAIHITSTSLDWFIGYLDTPPYSTSVGASGNYVDGNWHNVVGTYDKQNLKIYVDGVLKTTSNSFTSDILYSGDLLFIIGFHAESTTYFEGKISTTSLYNRALTATEVLQNYETTKTRFGL